MTKICSWLGQFTYSVAHVEEVDGAFSVVFVAFGRKLDVYFTPVDGLSSEKGVSVNFYLDLRLW